MSPSPSPDLVIIGGGIAGLTCLDHLLRAGFDAILVERSALGEGQSISSQGILHSGLKYLLHGPSPGEFRNLPKRWLHKLEATAEEGAAADLLLSRQIWVWSNGAWDEQLLLRIIEDRRAQELARPPAFLDGRVFSFPEPVVDVPSLLALLAQRHRTRIFRGDAIVTGHPRNPVVTLHGRRLEPQRVLLTAGAGNEAWLHHFETPVRMRRLPLHMVVVKGPSLPDLWGHGVSGTGPPDLTVTTHGPGIWYLGGRISEEGVSRTRPQQIEAARTLIARMLPKVDLAQATFTTLRVDRAEPERPSAQRFEIQVAGDHRLWIAWPTKLVLAPRLADLVLERLKHEGVEPSADQTGSMAPEASSVPVATPPW